MAERSNRLKPKQEEIDLDIDDRVIELAESEEEPVSYTHLTLPTICSV